VWIRYYSFKLLQISKMKKILFLLSAIISITSLQASAQNPSTSEKIEKCTSSPCGNTATGEDPQEQRIREAVVRANKIRDGDDDQKRWETISLYSDSTKPEKLKMTVVKAAKLEMQLDPKLGHISFSMPGVKQIFSIASPLGDERSICPRYSIDVVQASPAHVLLRMSCLKTQYSPGRYHMSVDYYLYDLETAVMRTIWAASVNDKNAHLPDAKPTPSLKIIPNGYRFDWSGVQPSDGKASTTTLHNIYVRSTEKTGKKILLCTNLSAPQGQGVEDEMCEGGILPAVEDKNRK
jgi:hypothetical protein